MPDPAHRFAVATLLCAPITALLIGAAVVESWRIVRGGGLLDRLAGDT